MMEKLFNQSAVWDEVIPSTSSLTKEGHSLHTLERIRFSSVMTGRSADSMGYRAENSSVLFYLDGHSQAGEYDGEGIPPIKEGDHIVVGSRKLTVTSVAVFAGLDGSEHHMEVYLR